MKCFPPLRAFERLSKVSTFSMTSHSPLTPATAEFMELPEGTRGALVVKVMQDSPADEAGLQGSDKTLKSEGREYPLGGDVIVNIDGQPVEEMDDLIAYLVERTRPGDTVTLEVIRADGRQEEITVTLGERPRPEDIAEGEK